MNRLSTHFAILILMLPIISMAQDKPFEIKFSGYVKTDAFFDSRQSSASNGIREGHFYLYPDNVLYDADSNDINANPSFHILGIQTRVKIDFSGPDAFGAKLSGVIESEFFGTSDADMNGFRLRHAFSKLKWEKAELMIGQYWHPMFPLEVFAATVGSNVGTPFSPFSRNPQIKFTRSFGKANFSLTAYSQRDFTSPGPDGNSNKYMRNGCFPGGNLRLVAPIGEIFTLGAGGDYKILQPEIKTAANYATKQTIGSLSAFLFLKTKTKPLNISLMGTYAQNGADFLMNGGYAVTEITDTLREYKKYTTLNTAAFWIDLTTNGKKLTLGLFGGYSINLGANDDIIGAVYARGSNIANIYRVSTRALFTQEKMTFGVELEMTTAAYGSMQIDGSVINPSNVTNLRFLLGVTYKF